MSRKAVSRKKVVFDEENPEWTKEMLARSRPASELPQEILDAFPKTRGSQKTAKKVPVSIRLSKEVVDHFRRQGPGWQTRIDEALKKAVNE